MRLPGVYDATARYLVLTAVGVFLLGALPASSLGDAPLWALSGRAGPTAANLIGIALIEAAWVYFIIVVVLSRAVRSRDAACWFAIFGGAAFSFAAAAALVLGAQAPAYVALLLAALVHLGLAVRVQRAVSASSPSGAEASAGLS